MLLKEIYIELMEIKPILLSCSLNLFYCAPTLTEIQIISEMNVLHFTAVIRLL